MEFVIDLRVLGGTIGIVHTHVLCLGARLCIRLPTQSVYWSGTLHVHASVPAAGWGIPENRKDSRR